MFDDRRIKGRLPSLDKSLTFASRAEYACGVLLEKYIPGFELETNKTFQVNVGFGKTIDFVVNNVFVEFHPISLHREFDNRVALRHLLHSLKHVKQSTRQDIAEAIADEMAEKYYRRRRFLVTVHAGADKELIVAHDKRQFYRYVIRRFGKDFPTEDVFCNEFNRLCDAK